MKIILCLSAHPDDCEFGCGATIAKLAAEGNKIYYVAFSDCEKSLLEGQDIRAEMREATRILGIQREDVTILDYEVREFPSKRQQILEDLINIRKRINPSVVFLPCKFDIHQDHHVIYEEGVRAFKNVNIFGYEMPWNTLQTSLSCYSIISERDLAKKTMAIGEYTSQADRPYSCDLVRPLARVRGIQVNEIYAEAFEVIRMKI